MKLPLISFHLRFNAGWLRVNNRVLSWTTLSPMFSERYGYQTPLIKIGRFRIFFDKEGA